MGLSIGCKRKDKLENTPKVDDNIQLVIEDFLLQQETEYIISTTLRQWQNNDNSFPSQSCPKVSITILDSITGWPRKLTIDFENGCKDPYKTILRKGKLLITYNSPWEQREVGDSVYITTENYYVENKKITGTWKIYVNSLSYFKIEAINVYVVYPDGSEIKWNSKRDRMIIAGSATPDYPYDDVYETRIYEGEALSRKGTKYRFYSRKLLTLPQYCAWITDGIIEIILPNSYKNSIDFGNGSCDNEAIITTNNKTIPYIMK